MDLLFILGLALVNGMTRFLRLVIQPQRWYGSLGFILGIALVLSGYCIIGMAVEIAGFTFLFWDFIPTAVGYLQRTPLLGYLMELSGINQVLERITPARRRKLSEG
ncbi:hypothetical protein SARC_11184 [Sphaeroforma arctica JP610]|uniref:Vesicle transport protein n=1 Tax=Sphaeroforma arctica JP610 TaxID=667725 RepID=A0A0L0FHP9_9EUKA|nr:hypothetical protein SARC_11184 [Sphaeroforma arctica JP610]KNC76307.1 hypothetical protein SARC_11184 [Sphaeroforma arctica JP610]|eukprot:XP_014150209.1 hypothetical protein SARC_11184 [Sphaeroforma arctica JP610]